MEATQLLEGYAAGTGQQHQQAKAQMQQHPRQRQQEWRDSFSISMEMHETETSKRRESGEIGDPVMGGQVTAMMSELGKDAKIPDRWRMSALLDICPQDVKETMVMRLDEIDEN